MGGSSVHHLHLSLACLLSNASRPCPSRSGLATSYSILSSSPASSCSILRSLATSVPVFIPSHQSRQVLCIGQLHLLNCHHGQQMQLASPVFSAAAAAGVLISSRTPLVLVLVQCCHAIRPLPPTPHGNGNGPPVACTQELSPSGSSSSSSQQSKRRRTQRMGMAVTVSSSSGLLITRP